MELKLGDKIWMDVGPNNFVVGHILDHSPDYNFIALSPVPYDEYRRLPLMQRGQVPQNWYNISYCHYLCHIRYEDLQKMDETLKPQAGFTL